jgi:hypothetical protein
MAPTDRQKRARNAEYQARWRAKRKALVRSHPKVVEAALLQAAEGCGQLSARERRQLADRPADLALGYLRRSRALAALARRVQAGEH